MQSVKHLWMLLFVYFLAMGLDAQELKVLDGSSYKPIKAVLIYGEALQQSVVTNAAGVADISAFVNEKRIKFQSLGYETTYSSYDNLKKNGFKIFLKPVWLNIEEVSVKGKKYEYHTTICQYPIVIDPKNALALNGTQTTADLLGQSGEVFIQKSQQAGGSPMIRGFATNRLLYTMDGVRMNNAIFRGGNIQNVISIDPFNLKSVEVFMGAGGVRFGSDAIGGVMQFASHEPVLSKNNKPLVTSSATLRHATANQELSGNIFLNYGRKKWAFVSNISQFSFQDLRMGSRGPEEYLRQNYVLRMDSVDRVVQNENPLLQRPTAYQQFNTMQKVRFRPNRFWLLTYAFHYSETSPYSRYDRLLETAANGLPRSAVWNYGPQVWRMHYLSATYLRPTRFFDRVGLKLAQQYFQESRIDRNFAGSNRFRLRTQTEHVNAYSLNVDLEKKWKKHQFYYGAEWVLNKVTSLASARDIRNGELISVADRYPRSDWRSGGAYLDYAYQLHTKMKIEGGVRYSNYGIVSDFSRHLQFYPLPITQSQLKNNALTGHLGVSYIPQASLVLHASVGTGFRAPNVDDIGKLFDFVQGGVIVPNTNLKAEYAYNAEVGIRKKFADKHAFQLAGFYTLLDNAMVRRSFQINGQDSLLFNGEMSQVYAIQNAAQAFVYGLSAGVEIELNSQWGVKTRFNWQRGREEMDNGAISASRHAAPAFGQTLLNYKTENEAFIFQVYAQYSAQVSHANLNEEERQKPAIYAVDSEGNPYSPGWYSLGFKTLYRKIQNTEISAGIDNITDQRYRPYSSGLVAPGRNFTFAVKVFL
jgi:hemoglobin/transferrin/lactoferrin receptor protein